MHSGLCLCRAWWEGIWHPPLHGVLLLEGGKRAFEFPAQGPGSEGKGIGAEMCVRLSSGSGGRLVRFRTLECRA